MQVVKPRPQRAHQKAQREVAEAPHPVDPGGWGGYSEALLSALYIVDVEGVVLA